MISRFFEGTKPINYLVLLIFLFVFFLLTFHLKPLSPSIENTILGITSKFAALVLQIYIVNEIARKADLTEMSSYPMLFFILLITAFSEVLFNINVIICNFFLVLTIQELLTIDTSKRNNLNFFNASLWLCIASIFYPLAIFFFIPIVFGILFYGLNNIKNWFMPIMGVICFLLIAYMVTLLFSAPQFLWEHYQISFPKEMFSNYNFDSYTRLTFYVLANIVLLFIIFSRLQDIGKGRVAELRMLLLFFAIGVLMTAISLGSNMGWNTILFTFCPVSIFITNYFQIFKRKLLREYVLLFVIIAPILISIWKLFG